MAKVDQKKKNFFTNSRLSSFVNTRIGFFALIVFLLWAKTILAYIFNFNLLGVSSIFQFLIMLINPLAITILLLGVGFLFKKASHFYVWEFAIYILLTLLLFSNVLYYREFSQFMTVNTVLGFKFVNQGLGASGFSLFVIGDFLYWLDVIVLLVLVFRKKIKLDQGKVSRRFFYGIISGGFLLGSFNLAMANISRPQLITRQFDNTYMVKYLGINGFTIQDAVSTYQVDENRKNANAPEFDGVKEYVNQHFAGANPEYYGKADGKNVIILHLESLQQVSIDRQINGQEVMPFINSIYHSEDTISFDNFFHQVGQGKTSDAENMLETSTFGLPTGSLFSKLGSDQLFQAMPAILNQRKGYSSAVFHGNSASFWNRSTVYKNMGYQNFFDASFYDVSGRKSLGYGLKDKLLFPDSIQYLETLQQPFYVKYLTVSNHFPYDIDAEDLDPNFVTSNSGSSIVDRYWQTNRYLDQSIQQFFDYLKKSGLYDNSIVVLYGDHYGISNSENKALANAIGEDSENWNAFDDAQMQRVPFMIHIPNSKLGQINHTYGGEIDVMPTLEHLLGVSTGRYIQFGQDLLSSQHQQLVIFRNKDFITPDYSFIEGELYDNKTQQKINLQDADSKLQEQVKQWQEQVDKALKNSDLLNNKNLLKFYTPKGFERINPANFNYGINSTIERLRKTQSDEGDRSTSLYSQNNNQSTRDLYQTDATEINDPESDSTRITVNNPDDSPDSDDDN